jgi:2-polyprenyl-3-methyl-5-hydroxy-6-metoxy-1,4-benzoquinol methylase
MKTPYTKVAKLWHTGMVLSGLDASLRRYMQRVELSLPQAPRVLDAGCGSGVLGQAILERFPQAQVIATDVDERMAESAERIARKRGHTSDRFTVAIGDIHEPARMRLLTNGEVVTVGEGTFDLVITGAVLEHADLSKAIPALAALVAPNGYFFNIGMGELPIVKVYEKMYGAAMLSRSEIMAQLRAAGFEQPHIKPLAPTELPANLTRSGIIARKPGG